MTDSTRIVASPDQVSCDFGGEAAMLHLKSGMYYGLNQVGAHLWNLIQEPRTFSELKEILARDYEVAPEVLETDLREYLNALSEHNLVELEG